jgi:hypothetical protein
MDQGKSKLTVLDRNQNYGLYVWKMDNGSIFKDSEGNTMNIPGRKHDLEAMAKLQKAAKYFDLPSGGPHFMAGSRRVSEEEYSEQKQRLAEGYIPSETDIGAWMDAERGARQDD